MNIEALHQRFLECTAVCTDTRKVQEGDLFFALKGDNFNGNKFAAEALEKGAKYAVIDEAEYLDREHMFLVSDALEALQQLATYHRNWLNIPIISLTGSNGKTTTKELINAVLSTGFKTSATLGNLNNHIGVPLTLLSMTKSTEIGIVEMGANHQKEIEFLCNIAQPNYGYITNFGKAHLEGFGGIEGVIKGKSELYDHLKANDGLLFINGNDTKQIEQAGDYKKTVVFSDDTNRDVQIEVLNADPMVSVRYKEETIHTHLIGRYNANNIAAAIAIGDHFKLTPEAIKKGIEGHEPDNNRSQIMQRGTNKLIMDAYNANPTSMKAALENLSGLSDVKKIAFLGDMFELGETAIEEHQGIYDLAHSLNVDQIYLVGSLFGNVQGTSSKITVCSDFDSFKDLIMLDPPINSTILIKGSRGMAMERILEVL